VILAIKICIKSPRNEINSSALSFNTSAQQSLLLNILRILSKRGSFSKMKYVLVTEIKNLYKGITESFHILLLWAD